METVEKPVHEQVINLLTQYGLVHIPFAAEPVEGDRDLADAMNIVALASENFDTDLICQHKGNYLMVSLASNTVDVDGNSLG